MNNLKVEGKPSDWCIKCKNCKSITRECDGRLTKVECVDPYDGMVKTLDVDSDICCSMFEPKPPCEKCERFEGTYCHSSNGIFVTSYMGLFGDYATGNCPLYEEKKETCETKTAREIELEARITALLSEKADHLKDIERLDEDCKRIAEKNKRAEIHIKNLKHQMDRDSKVNIEVVAKLLTERDKLKNENTSLNTINKGLAEDRKKLINYIRSLKIASENYLKEFTYEED
jgi:hypothetical protein